LAGTATGRNIFLQWDGDGSSMSYANIASLGGAPSESIAI